MPWRQTTPSGRAQRMFEAYCGYDADDGGIFRVGKLVHGLC